MSIFLRISAFFVVAFFLSWLFLLKIDQTPKYATIDILIEEREAINKEIVKELKKRDIPYRIKKNGVILYPEKEKEKVGKIVDKAIAHIKGRDKAGVTIYDNRLKKIFLAMLDEKNIPYWIKHKKEENTESIRWDDKYDAQINILLMKAQKSYGLKKPPFISFNNNVEFRSIEELLKKEKIEYRVIDCEFHNIPCIEYEWKDYMKVREITAKAYKNFLK